MRQLRHFFNYFMLIIGIFFITSSVHATLRPGNSAFNFSGTDSEGKQHSLTDYKGKVVVLEWTNHLCPFVRKLYDSGKMQALQKKYTDEGVVWLTIISAAPAKQGYVTPAHANSVAKRDGAHPTAILLDTQGKIGKLYRAKTTPTMVIIDKNGKLAYMGAIDDKPSTDVNDVATADNYVADALEALKAGKEIESKQTESYGCAIKY